ncbi:hypothetical protein FJT64_003003 [Amphibalanus amphitrite]|uniref:Uncharacterized protein n=1 Tax=Amphibalanus amphitrite TaxID=1232801 RepID=A0A6A4WEJ4_AMPAM|nr:hypothetical protein FJT64_003003 [Amphibalanus amphitrite]
MGAEPAPAAELMSSPLVEPGPVQRGAPRRLARACSFLSPRAERLLRSVRLQQTALRVRASLTELCRGVSLTDLAVPPAPPPLSLSTRSCPEPSSPPSATAAAFVSMWQERDQSRLARGRSCETLPRCRPAPGNVQPTPTPQLPAGRLVKRSRVHRRTSPPAGRAEHGPSVVYRRVPGRAAAGPSPARSLPDTPAAASVQRRHSCYLAGGGDGQLPVRACRGHIHSWHPRHADTPDQQCRSTVGGAPSELVYGSVTGRGVDRVGSEAAGRSAEAGRPTCEGLARRRPV